MLAAGLQAASPNFVLLLSDDQSWNGLSVRMDPDVTDSAHDYVETPHIAGLAQEGMRFTQAYAPAPVCSPTRISLQTGKSCAQLGWTKAAPNLPASDGLKLIAPPSIKFISTEEITLAEWLQQAGYVSAHYGKWHIGGGGPEAHGYAGGDGATGNADAAKFKDPNPVDIFGMGERAAAFMEQQQSAGNPFFIQMSYNALHYPQNARQVTKDKYEVKLSNFRGRNKERQIGRAALAEDLDAGIGLLLEAIDRLGLRENTYVIYMSDNGGSAGKRGGLQGGKGSLGEGGIRVPFIIRGPGIAANSINRVPIVGYDLFPTFSKLAGIIESLPEGIEGGDVSPLFAESKEPITRMEEGMLFHFPHYQSSAPCSALIKGNYKVIHDYESETFQLFDLDLDLSERQDLANTQQEVAKELHQLLITRLQETGARLPSTNPDAIEGKVNIPERGKKSGKKKSH